MQRWWLALALVGLLSGPEPVTAQRRLDCRVAHITDGDTFWALP